MRRALCSAAPFSPTAPGATEGLAAAPRGSLVDPHRPRGPAGRGGPLPGRSGEAAGRGLDPPKSRHRRKRPQEPIGGARGQVGYPRSIRRSERPISRARAVPVNAISSLPPCHRPMVLSAPVSGSLPTAAGLVAITSTVAPGRKAEEAARALPLLGFPEGLKGAQGNFLVIRSESRPPLCRKVAPPCAGKSPPPVQLEA